VGGPRAEAHIIVRAATHQNPLAIDKTKISSEEVASLGIGSLGAKYIRDPKI
jgi:hypothetical protein